MKNFIEIPENVENLSPETVKAGVIRRANRAKQARASMRRVLVIAMLIVSVLCMGVITWANTRTTETPVPAEEPAEEDTVFMPSSIYWDISEDDRELVELAVMGVARGENELCQLAVAQCIRDAALYNKMTVPEVIRLYSYPIFEDTPSDSCIAAVDAAIAGKDAIGNEVVCCYNPAVQDGSYHETLNFVCQIGNLKFFN